MGSSSPKPEFVTILADQNVKSGVGVTLRCEANTEHLTASWKKDGNKLSCVQGKHSVKVIGKTCTLVINNAQESDEGNYTITLINHSGSVSCSAFVRVEIKEWRTVQWSQQEKMLNTLKAFKNCNEIPELRFLLYGSVGAGKSSTINTIKTIFEGRQFVNCLAAANSKLSHTRCYESFRFANEGGSFPFAFYDIMGAETEKENGVHTEDVISALKGHVREGYMFSTSPLSENNHYYNKNPSLIDQMHCLVYVIKADSISLMGNDFITNFKDVRKAANKMGIPQVVFMTRADLACPITKENLQNVYKSKRIRENMYKCSYALGVPVNCIFPVMNYHEETHMSININCLMLDSLTHIIHWANDYVEKCSQQPNFE